MEFKKYKIGEIGEVIGGGTPSTKRDDFYGGNIPWITPKDLAGFKGVYVTKGKRNITELGLNKSSAKLLPANTVLMTSRAPIGYLAIAENPISTNQGFKSIICNESVVKPKFLFYLLKNNMEKIKSLGTGSTFSEISGKVVKDIELYLPNLKIQTNIEKVLFSLDKKIELNQKIIANLEELSQTLFKHWFVDFEFPDENGNPYQSSGGAMVESELGEIPKGWKIGYLDYLSKKLISGDWGKEKKQNNYIKPVRIIRGADINDYSLGGKGKAPIRYVIQKSFENKKIIPGDIIIEISGGSSTQSTGRSLLINENIIESEDYSLLCTNFCKVLRPKNEKYGEWIDYFLKHLYNRNVFFSYENGTTGIKNLDYKSLLNVMKVIIPTEQLLLKFHELISIYKKDIQNLGNEIQKLTELRDTLLPKLMSGEIEMADEVLGDEDEFSI
ncbi:restriction endonuclease subunit S [Staphylococcus delphini]|uniref:restriction endonuclease subunit S n=1 Tax=Staphylococcus delphini TaxID=53344 RepID=UPI0023B329A3|nr:restriction endonuclease subunit S [Staphylococcus delphini]MDE9751706.1 restriction endonuclease subunit S [Staphylococcus delphini]MDE9788983.1 restriction endonuclease subunit S [Staphylococcus delphini]MDE9791384.1 restriction endonuclease subunit S [Staphylococcus delphini]MDE9793714.1 restriction endonuclease subunit S [Staphylococcus delphini]MDE9795936.1 restriction endonuclease subunit S [Staphylococcus delphini]